MYYTETIFGSIPALITPFTQSGDIDLESFKNLLSWHVDKGSHGLVICGTTGESPTVTDEEHLILAKAAVENTPEGYPIIIGCGSNATQKAIKLTRQAQQAGASAALIVVPYYNKPSQQGLYAHFKAIHDATTLPIILYNVPSRTITDISDETVIALAQLERIIGIKDATGDLSRLENMKKHISKDFTFLSGDDMSATQYIQNGGQGCISVSANVVPDKCAAVYNALKNGDTTNAMQMAQKLAPLHNAMFIEPSPAAAKYALAQMEKIENIIRLPLLPLSAEGIAKIENTLKQNT